MTSKKVIWREYLTILSLLWTWLSPIGKRFTDAQIYVYKHGRKFNISSKHCAVVWSSDNTAEAANVPSERDTHDQYTHNHTTAYHHPNRCEWNTLLPYIAYILHLWLLLSPIVVHVCAVSFGQIHRFDSCTTVYIVYKSAHYILSKRFRWEWERVHMCFN